MKNARVVGLKKINARVDDQDKCTPDTTKLEKMDSVKFRTAVAVRSNKKREKKRKKKSLAV